MDEDSPFRDLVLPPAEYPKAPFSVAGFLLGVLVVMLAVSLLWWWLPTPWLPLVGLPAAITVFLARTSRTTSRFEEALWRQLYARACEGEPEAQFVWGRYCVGPQKEHWDVPHMAMIGSGVSNAPEVILKPEAGIPFLLKAAETGHVGAQCALGKCYADGVGIARDPAQAVQWTRLAAEQGLLEAQRNLARMYDDGIGVPKDAKEAIRWYRQAAAQDDEYARQDLERLEGAS
jgi:hypothetical protein